MDRRGHGAERERLLTPAEVAEMLAVRPQTLAVWRLRKTVKLPWIKIGSAVRYRRADVEQFITANTIPIV